MVEEGTRIRVVGTSKFVRIRVDLGAEETVARQQLVTRAATKLQVAGDAGGISTCPSAARGAHMT